MLRVAVHELASRLARRPAPLILDARRSQAFRERPAGLPGAIPIFLDREPQVPDLARDSEIYVYCLCRGETSSARVAMWLTSLGFERVAILTGGLPAWEAARAPLRPVDLSTVHMHRWLEVDPRHLSERAQQHIVERIMPASDAPVRRDMAVVFVDIVDSTRLVISESAEEVLRRVQALMRLMVDIAVEHCGDVHDFQGDGALLYFSGTGEAMPAVFHLRDALRAARDRDPTLPNARFSIDQGPLVMGNVGSRQRSTISFIGPCINRAARLLRYAPANGVITTETVLEESRRTAPDLASTFALVGRAQLKGFDETVALYCSPGLGLDLGPESKP